MVRPGYASLMIRSVMGALLCRSPRGAADEVLAQIPSVRIRRAQDERLAKTVSELELHPARVQRALREVRVVQIRVDRGDAALAIVCEQRPIAFLFVLADEDAGLPR